MSAGSNEPESVSHDVNMSVDDPQIILTENNKYEAGNFSSVLDDLETMADFILRDSDDEVDEISSSQKTDVAALFRSQSQQSQLDLSPETQVEHFVSSVVSPVSIKNAARTSSSLSIQQTRNFLSTISDHLVSLEKHNPHFNFGGHRSYVCP